MASTCLLASRSPACRWHELDLGFYKERGNLSVDIKGAMQVEAPRVSEYRCDTQGRIDP